MPPPNPQLKSYTDDEINQILTNTGTTILKQIKDLDDDKLTQIIKNKYPDADQDSVKRTIDKIRNI